jgi:hypothetical protein
MVCLEERTIGRLEMVWGQMGVITIASREGKRMGPPAERE